MEQSTIIDKVNFLHKSGVKKMEAFKLVANELNITPSNCQTIYYSKNKKTKNRVKFSADEKKFIIDTILEFASKEKTVKSAIDYCSNQLKAPFNRVRGVWERERDKRNLKTRERDNNEWTKEEDLTIIDTLIKETHNGEQMKDVFEKIDKKLKRKSGSSRSRWYNCLCHDYDDKIKKIYFQWDDEKDLILLNTIKKFSALNKTLTAAFSEAAKIIGDNCTLSICNARYKDKIFKNKLELDLKIGHFTDEEDEILLKTMNEEINKGNTDWDAAKKASSLLGRNHQSCLSRWNNNFKLHKKEKNR